MGKVTTEYVKIKPQCYREWNHSFKRWENQNSLLDTDRTDQGGWLWETKAAEINDDGIILILIAWF